MKTNSPEQEGKGKKKIKVFFLRNRSFNGFVELPADIWYVVMECLSLYDQIRVLSVCKKFSNQFSLKLRRNIPINRLPWLVEFDTSELNNFTFKMFDPIHEQPYQTLRIQNFSPDYIVSKHGWLLLLREKRRRKKSNDSVAELFLICPYTMEIVLLPDLIIKYLSNESLCSVSQTRSNTCCRKHRHVQIRATFSMSNPKSEDCLFFVVYLSVDSCEVSILCYQKKINKEWKMKSRFIHIRQDGELPSISGLEYCNGNLYLLMKSDLLILTYDHLNGISSRSLPFHLHSVFLLILDGSIHIVASSLTLKQQINDDYDKHCFPFVCQASDLLRNIENGEHIVTKVRRKELGNHRALFLGTSSCDSAFVVEDMSEEELGLFGNKICFHENCQQIIDLSTGKSEIQRKYFLRQEYADADAATDADDDDNDDDDDDDDDADGDYRYRKMKQGTKQGTKMDSTRGEVEEEGRKLISLRTLGKESIHNSHSRPLSDLQADFWDEVIEFLNFYDQIRLLSVCKSFSNRFSLHFQLHRNDPINQLPWLIEFETSESNNFTFKLFDPIHKFPYKTLRIEQFSPDYIVSKHGWLLFMKQKRDEENDYSVAELFLVCPYTNEMILLPDLITGFWNIEKLCSASHTLKDTCRLNHSHVQARAIFTNSNPKSEECIFFVVYFAVDLHEFTIFSYQKRNREEWKRNICSHPYFEYRQTSSITGIEYNQGLLYVLMKCGPHLWMFVYGHRHRPLVVFHVSFNAFRYFPDCVNVNLLVLDGSLHIAVSDLVLKKTGDNDVVYDDEYSMFVWNKFELFKFKDMVAREKKELGNRALFLGTASWDSAFVVEDMSGEELQFLGNRICFHEKCQETFDSSTNRGEIQRKYFVGGQEEPYRYRTMAWIQSPNHVKFSSSSSG